MPYSVAIIENSMPAYIAEPVTDENNVAEIILEPIVAWKVIYESTESNEFSDTATAIPVTIHAGLPSTYAVYYSDTEIWSIPEVTTSKGLDRLLEYFQSNLDK